MRKIHHGIETTFIEKIIHNPHNQRIWQKMQPKPWFHAVFSVMVKIFAWLNKYRWQDYKLYSIPLSHLDAAWLWTVKDAKFRAYKTFKMALEHSEKYPHFSISLTSPQYFEWMHRYNHVLPTFPGFPTFWDAIRTTVEKGNIDLCDGSWIEPDLNVPSGESLIRQRLYGQKFYMEHFGKYATIATLLDVFGYPNTYPQILKKSGAQVFWTTKLTWNDLTAWPFANFQWRGLDGSEIFTHIFKFNIMVYMDVGRYKVMARRPKKANLVYDSHTIQDAREKSPIEIGGSHLATRNYSGLDELKPVLSDDFVHTLGLFYGVGDGGKGPLSSEIDLMAHLDRDYQVRPTNTTEYFRLLREDVGEPMVTWNDELYLEYHRGTLTTQAKVKQGNAEAEKILSAAETLFTLDALYRSEMDTKILSQLQKLWKTLLLHQFHDILPGSSIPEVYILTWKDHARIRTECQKIIESIMQRYLPKENSNSNSNNSPKILLFNPTNSSTRFYHSFNEGSTIKITPEMRGIGLFSPVLPSEVKSKIPRDKSLNITQSKDLWVVDTKHISVNINPHTGNIVKVVSKIDKNKTNTKQRNYILGAIGTRFLIYRENFASNFYPAWNICRDYPKDKVKIEFKSISLISQSDEEIQIEIHYRFLKSSLSVKYTIHQDQSLIRIQTKIDLQDPRCFIKHFFPLAIESDNVICSTQMGNIVRKRNPKTVMEKAKWEFSIHRWMDLSDEHGGMGILNQDRYGASANKYGIGLTLVRSPPYPGDGFYSHEEVLSGVRPQYTDLMDHTFEYAMYPHEGTWQSCHLPQIAEAYSHPCMELMSTALTSNSLPDANSECKAISKFPFVEIDKPNVLISAFKFSESETAKLENESNTKIPSAKTPTGFICRVYECEGRSTEFNLILINIFPSAASAKGLKVENLDLLEDPIAMEKKPVMDAQRINSSQGWIVSLKIKPYEILTLRIGTKIIELK